MADSYDIRRNKEIGDKANEPAKGRVMGGEQVSLGSETDKKFDITAIVSITDSYFMALNTHKPYMAIISKLPDGCYNVGEFLLGVSGIENSHFDDYIVAFSYLKRNMAGKIHQEGIEKIVFEDQRAVKPELQQDRLPRIFRQRNTA